MTFIKYHWNQVDLTESQIKYIENVYKWMEGGSCRATIEQLGINVSGKNVLEVGCGPGQLLVELSKDSPSKLLGVDLDEAYLKFAATEFRNRNIINFILIRADATSLPFPDGYFDLVISFLTLPYVKDDKKALTEFSRVLKRGGALVISGHEKGFPIRYVKQRKFKPLLIYIASLIYLLSGKKFILNTLQSYKKLSRYLPQIGISIEQIILSKKSFGFVETFKIKGLKHSPIMRKLIVNADDFGLTDGVNQAVIECYKNGSISSATLMVNADATEEAVKLAKENPELGVGLHFNIATGKPISNPDMIPSLVSHDGFFHERKVFERKSMLGLINPKDVEREFLSQVRLYQDFGLRMTHIDSDQHTHVHLSVFSVVSKYCIQNCIPLRIPHVSYFTNSDIFCRRNVKRVFRSSLLKLLIRLDRLSISSEKLISNDQFYSIFDFMPVPKVLQKEHYFRILDNLKEGISELMVHPALVDEKLKRLTKITDISQQEYNALMSFSLRDECQKRAIEFINYGDLH